MKTSKIYQQLLKEVKKTSAATLKIVLRTNLDLLIENAGENFWFGIDSFNKYQIKLQNKEIYTKSGLIDEIKEQIEKNLEFEIH